MGLPLALKMPSNRPTVVRVEGVARIEWEKRTVSTGYYPNGIPLQTTANKQATLSVGNLLRG